MKNVVKYLHLTIAAIVILIVALIYGSNPQTILPQFFDFSVTSVDLKNIFRSQMFLYFAFAGYWVYGILRFNHWKSATLSNVLFMGSLAIGRLFSFYMDGFSLPYFKGFLLELCFALWGIYNLKKYR